MTAEHAGETPRRSASSWALLVIGCLAAATAVVVAVLAWVQPLADLSRDEARTFTANAFEAAGVDVVAVWSGVNAAVYPDERDEEPEFDVWVTTAVIEGQPVKLWIDRAGVQAVKIDDNTPDGPLLSERELLAVDAHSIHPGADDRRRRNLLVTGAAALVVIAGIGLVVVSRRLGSESGSESGSGSGPEAPA